MSWQDDFVQAVNDTDNDIEWDGYIYHPGQRRMVPYLAMTNSFGDPRSVNGTHQIFRAPDGTSGVIAPREIQRGKVSVAWNAGSGPGYSITWDQIPKITFYNVDGERIYTVVDDPTGDKIMPANASIEHQRDLETTIRRQQRQINQLLALQGIEAHDLPDDEIPPDLADIPADDSTASTTQSPWAHAENE